MIPVMSRPTAGPDTCRRASAGSGRERGGEAFMDSSRFDSLELWCSWSRAEVMMSFKPVQGLPESHGDSPFWSTRRE